MSEEGEYLAQKEHSARKHAPVRVSSDSPQLHTARGWPQAEQKHRGRRRPPRRGVPATINKKITLDMKQIHVARSIDQADELNTTTKVATEQNTSAAKKTHIKIERDVAERILREGFGSLINVRMDGRTTRK